jgi:glutamate-1-semialdehyde aminotransferase
MEPMRAVQPKNNFLHKVKNLAKKNNVVLIFDEITSGFKDNYGGLHLKFKVEPDLAIFGKSLGNGYPISAIIGKKKIMKKAEETFISSTMWTDRLGFIAAKTTLNKIKKLKVNRIISRYGLKIKKGWSDLAKKNNLKIIISGMDSIPNFKFDYPNNLKISTFFTQEMLKAGYLANTTIATTYAYNDKIISAYLKQVDRVFEKINIGLKSNKLILSGKIKHSTFQRTTG